MESFPFCIRPLIPCLVLGMSPHPLSHIHIDNSVMYLLWSNLLSCSPQPEDQALNVLTQ